MISTIWQPAMPISLDSSHDGSTAFIGTSMGAFRAYDLTDRENPRLVLQSRFYEDPIPINTVKVSPCGKFLLVSSSESKQAFVMSASAEDKF